jgi:hypothetical protein
MTNKSFTVIQSVSLILPAHGGMRNGYRQLAVMSLSSPILLDTVISVATVYMHLRKIVPRSLALQRQSRALASLRKSVHVIEQQCSSNSANVDAVCLKRELLAAILLQITVEIANGTGYILSHTMYAVRLFRELGYDSAEPTSSVGTIIVQRLTYITVLSSVFWQCRPMLPESFWYYHMPEESSNDRSSPSLQETTGCPLWVMGILSRICHLTADASEGAARADIIARGREIEGDLILLAREHLDGNSDQCNDGDDEARYLDIVGRCNYWSATILLQRRVFRDSHESSRVQYSLEKLLSLLESLPLGCGPDTQISLSLYVAAIAAVRPSHRARIKAKNRQLAGIYPMEARNVLTTAFDTMWATTDRDLNRASRSSSGDGQVEAGSDLMKDGTFFIC